MLIRKRIENYPGQGLRVDVYPKRVESYLVEGSKFILKSLSVILEDFQLFFIDNTQPLQDKLMNSFIDDLQLLFLNKTPTEPSHLRPSTPSG